MAAPHERTKMAGSSAAKPGENGEEASPAQSEPILSAPARRYTMCR